MFERVVYVHFEDGREIPVNRRDVLTPIDANWYARYWSKDGVVKAVSIRLDNDILKQYNY